MRSIDSLPMNLKVDIKTMGKSLNQDSAMSESPFSMLLGEIEQLFLSLTDSSEEKALEEGKSEELPDWNEEQWKEVSELLTAFLQYMETYKPSSSFGIKKEDLPSMNDSEYSTWKQGGKGSLTLSEILPILHKMDQQGMARPQEVTDQFNKVIQYFDLEFFHQSVPKNQLDQMPHESSTGNWLLEKGLVILPSQSDLEAQQIDLDVLHANPEHDEKGNGPVSFNLNSTFTTPFDRASFHSPKQENIPIHKENFVQEMTDFLFSRMKVLQNGTEARLSLYPEHLGQVDVKITLQQGQLVAHFVAETSMGRDLLEANLAGLRSSMQQQGIQVTKIEVQTASEAGFLNQQQSQQHSGMYQQNQRSKRIQTLARLESLNLDEVNTAYENVLNDTGIDRGAIKSIDFTA